MELDKAITQRKSIRHFSDKKPNWRDIIECIDAARFAPMAGNLFSLRFILVDDKEKIKKIADAAQQPFISEAQYVVVACTSPAVTKNAYEKLAEKFLGQQAGAAIENFLLKIKEKGLETCWAGYFVESVVKEILRIPEGIEVEALFPIGYESKKRGAKEKRRQKIELDRILYFNKWKNKKMKNPKKINV
ncbi:nitroreductase family protein [Candidatus Pacearchaeota archaeon]|nr:MAG: nitroreductase family protein [Candidatus Pacearchaeota archaeon]